MRGGRRRQSGGNSLIEFTLVGIPIIFVLISIFQMSFGMWLYQTLAFAVREGTRSAIAHGVNCSRNGNTYCITVSGVAAVINNAARGLDPSRMTVTLTPSQGSAITDTLDNLMNTSTYSTTTWPPSSPPGANAVGQPITTSASYPFNSRIYMFRPSVKPVKPHAPFY